jgi:hypothetical protein
MIEGGCAGYLYEWILANSPPHPLSLSPPLSKESKKASQQANCLCLVPQASTHVFSPRLTSQAVQVQGREHCQRNDQTQSIPKGSIDEQQYEAFNGRMCANTQWKRMSVSPKTHQTPAANTFPLPSTHIIISPGSQENTGALNPFAGRPFAAKRCTNPPDSAFSLTNPSSATVRHMQHCAALRKRGRLNVQIDAGAFGYHVV